MSSRFAVPKALALAAGLLSVPSIGGADAWLPMPGEYLSEFRGTHVAWSSAYDDLGEKRPYSFDMLHESRELRSRNELGWKYRMSFILEVPVTSKTVRTLRTFSNTQTALSDLFVGGHFRVLDGPTALSLEVDWKIPMGYETTPPAAVGDGLHHFSGRLDFGRSIRPLQAFVQATGGYLARYDVRLNPTSATRHVGSDLLVYGGDIAFWVGNSVLLAARHTGLTWAGPGRPKVNSQAVGPEIRYRVDDRLDVFGGSSYVVAGRNTTKTDTYYVGLAFKQTRLDRLQGFLGGMRRP